MDARCASRSRRSANNSDGDASRILRIVSMDLRVVARGMRSEYDFRCRSYIRRGDNQPANNHAFNDRRMSVLSAIGNIAMRAGQSIELHLERNGSEHG